MLQHKNSIFSPQRNGGSVQMRLYQCLNFYIDVFWAAFGTSLRMLVTPQLHQLVRPIRSVPHIIFCMKYSNGLCIKYIYLLKGTIMDVLKQVVNTPSTLHHLMNSFIVWCKCVSSGFLFD